MKTKDYLKSLFSLAYLGLCAGIAYKLIERGLVEYLKDWFHPSEGA